jgi:putative pyruvate formate lyase activating enzyme
MVDLTSTFPCSLDRLPASLTGGGRFVVRREEFVPAYLQAHEKGSLKERVDETLEQLRCCRVCPRDCDVNRLQNAKGICRSGRFARVTSAFTHFGEEDCLRGRRGSGTIFFAWCNLRCVFCQTYETSQEGEGGEVSAEQLAAIMLRLQEIGCHNINLVTPEHVVPQILEALLIAIGRGLRLPIVYNTSAYDSMKSLQLLNGIVDVYMPDFKLWKAEHCRKYLKAADYAEVARNVVREMRRQVGDLSVDEDGLALRGVLVRHLVMPGLLEDTREIMRYLADLSPDMFVNVMDQYYPAWRARTQDTYKEINRQLDSREFDCAIRHAREAGLWRLDTCWRSVLPRFEYVPIPPGAIA